MADVARIQQEIRAAGFDGWLLCDFHNRDLVAYRVLGLDPAKFTSRRWFYWIPAHGEPVRLVSKVEPLKLDPLGGEKRSYLSWRELHAKLREVLGGAPDQEWVDRSNAALPSQAPRTAGGCC